MTVEQTTFLSLSPDVQREMIQTFIGRQLFSAVTNGLLSEPSAAKSTLAAIQQQFAAFLNTDPDTTKLFSDANNLLDMDSEEDQP